jgi:ssDNA-binding Zn-finger/Zn-ribbon topoisomerase 1
VREPGKADRKIILEYDGFDEHFADLPGINEKNYADYYSAKDVYRQKVLEGYGCRFLRINRFNVGKNPVQTLNQRLVELLAKGRNNNSSIENIHSAIEGLQTGELKECPKCKELRPLTDFENNALASGYGRYCVACGPRTTPRPKASKIVTATAPVVNEHKKCSQCGSRMIMRSGRYGRFLGCSKYPYCKATQKV